MVSIAMLLMLSFWKPYISEGDDRDAVLAQMVRFMCKPFIGLKPCQQFLAVPFKLGHHIGVVRGDAVINSA
jgi:hypothetical protein